MASASVTQARAFCHVLAAVVLCSDRGYRFGSCHDAARVGEIYRQSIGTCVDAPKLGGHFSCRIELVSLKVGSDNVTSGGEEAYRYYVISGSGASLESKCERTTILVTEINVVWDSVG